MVSSCFLHTASTSADDPRFEMLTRAPTLVVECGAALLPVLREVYDSFVNPSVRKKCLAAMRRMLYNAPADSLDALLPAPAAAALVATLLSSSSSGTIIAGVQIAYILMEKRPGVYARALEREGVVHEMRKLAEAKGDGEAGVCGVYIESVGR